MAFDFIFLLLSFLLNIRIRSRLRIVWQIRKFNKCLFNVINRKHRTSQTSQIIHYHRQLTNCVVKIIMCSTNHRCKYQSRNSTHACSFGIIQYEHSNLEYRSNLSHPPRHYAKEVLHDHLQYYFQIKYGFIQSK